MCRMAVDHNLDLTKHPIILTSEDVKAHLKPIPP